MKGEKELNTEQTMSKKQNGVLVTAPHFGTGRETVGEFPGYSCGYCQGNGYFQGDITVKDTELVPCPKCGGTGKVKGIVTVDWVPDGGSETLPQREFKRHLITEVLCVFP